MKPVECFDVNSIVVTVQRERKKRELVQVEANIQRLEFRLRVGQVRHDSTLSSSCPSILKFKPYKSLLTFKEREIGESLILLIFMAS